MIYSFTTWPLDYEPNEDLLPHLRLGQRPVWLDAGRGWRGRVAGNLQRRVTRAIEECALHAEDGIAQDVRVGNAVGGNLRGGEADVGPLAPLPEPAEHVRHALRRGRPLVHD